MSQTAGTSLLQQAQQLTERPQWAMPWGNAYGGSELVSDFFLRPDTPNGLSTQTPTPEANQAFRNAVQGGALVPMNDAAARLVVSVGGIQNGDPSPFGVPWIDGYPGGLDANMWNALTTRAEQQAAERFRQMELSGFVAPGTPTLERERIMGELRNQEFANQTSRLLAEAAVRQKDEDLARLERERLDAVRTGDLDRAQALQIEQDRQLLARQTLTGWIGGEGGTGPGGQATLAREQQAFEQAVKMGELAANPRTGLQAWMQGQRGGLAGQAPVNFVPPTTTAGAGAPGAGGPAAPGQAFQEAQQQTAAAPGLTSAFQVPTTAFGEALIQGRAVPNQGAIQTQGQMWNAQELQQAVNPGQWRAQDFLRGTRDEQAGALGLASFAGFSDETTEDLLRRNLPRFSAPTTGSVR